MGRGGNQTLARHTAASRGGFTGRFDPGIRIKNQIGADHVILQAASEWDDSEGGKARRWANIVTNEWPGKKSWNEGSRPESGAPADYSYDWHPCRVGDLPGGLLPRGVFIVNTDCGNSEGFTIYDLDTDRNRIPGYVAQVLRSGSSFHYYEFRNATIQEDVIQKIGQGKRDAGL